MKEYKLIQSGPENASTKHIAVWNQRLGPFVGGLAFLFGILLMFAVNWVLGLVVIISSVAGIAIMMSQIADDRASEFEATCKQRGFAYKSNLSDPEAELFLGLSENEAMMLVQFRTSDYEVKERLINIREILNVELVVDDLSVYKAGPVASLSAAAIGGIIYGGAGAVVGSLTTGHIGQGKIGRVTLKLRVNDIEDPLVEIIFVNKPAKASSLETQKRLGLAEKLANLIEVMRFRLSQQVGSVIGDANLSI